MLGWFRRNQKTAEYFAKIALNAKPHSRIEKVLQEEHNHISEIIASIEHVIRWSAKNGKMATSYIFKFDDECYIPRIESYFAYLGFKTLITDSTFRGCQVKELHVSWNTEEV